MTGLPLTVMQFSIIVSGLFVVHHMSILMSQDMKHIRK